jgi:hypothetical protein
MNIIVFDTETTSLDKPFAYNIGYVVYNTDTKEKLCRRDFVIEQVWHNLELFCSAYYADKRQLYVSRMKARKAVMDKFGYVCRQMRKDIQTFAVVAGYAYNSSFDERVFDFCCEWFKVSNPLDLIPVHDIRGYVHEFIAQTTDFQCFCETNQYLTESGNYSTTAETLFRYITRNCDFVEEHTALADSEIECEILSECVDRGAEWNKDYKVLRSIERVVEKELVVVHKGVETAYSYNKRINRGNKIILK